MNEGKTRSFAASGCPDGQHADSLTRRELADYFCVRMVLFTSILQEVVRGRAVIPSLQIRP